MIDIKDIITRDMEATTRDYRAELERLLRLQEAPSAQHRDTRAKRITTLRSQIPALVASIKRRKIWVADERRKEAMLAELDELDARLERPC